MPGGVQIFLCCGLYVMCLCRFRTDVCIDHRFHLHACTYTHILNRIEYTMTFSVLLVVIPPTRPFFAFNHLYY